MNLRRNEVVNCGLLQMLYEQGSYLKSKYSDRLAISDKAIREVFHNVITHRDYSLTGKDIKIAIYDDMVEITSPGKLLPSVEFDAMQARQLEIRNKVIAPLFKQFVKKDYQAKELALVQVTDQVADQVTDQVKQLLVVIHGKAGSVGMSLGEMLDALQLKHPTFRKNYLLPSSLSLCDRLTEKILCE